MSDVETKFHEAWIGMVQPIEGLVVSIPVLVDARCMAHNPPSLQQQFLELAPVVSRSDDGEEHRAIDDLRRLFSELLGLPPNLFHEGSALPEDLSLYVPEGQQTLRPTLGLKRMRAAPRAATASLPDDSTPASRAGEPYVALVWALAAGLSFDKPETTTGAWNYPPAAKFDRLLRACRVPIGILFNGDALRLIYAPHGESSGAITFHVDPMATVGGRPILDAFVMLLHARRFFGVAEEHQLPAILRDSRLRQANVTSDLAGQVFDALGVLVRGFEAAAERDGRSRLDDALARGADHLYGGLLTILLRLVFLLYAEDRGLMPTEDPVYAEHLSLLALFGELQRDAGTHPDSMSRRFGAWPRLLALFRAVFLGAKHGTLRLPPRRGQLFDPHVYPFLEGWGPAGSAPITQADERGRVQVPTIDDGTVFEILRRLLVLNTQRLSYRTLDVEQIGSVYETLMGYHVERAVGDALCVKPERVWITGEELVAEAPNRRAAYLEDAAGLAKSALAKISPLLSKAKTGVDALAAIEPFALRGEERELLRARAGQLIVQPGKERRRTSSHYTPRSLSGPIVRKTLEPLLVAMGSEPPSARLLDLKICDPAMGSGAFLVEACRFLGDQVVAAWTREGELSKVASVHEDVVNRARRLVAQRCLYGVDKNPFAVHLAKLSLWLVTLAKDEPFTFVDHALVHGDSLVGLNLDQIRGFHWKPNAQVEMCSKEIHEALDEAAELRTRILDLAEQPGAMREKERLLWDSEDAVARVRLLGDLVVGAFFAHESDRDRERERDRRLDLVSAWLREGGPPPDALRAMQAEIRAQIPVLHWMTEFPEVFDLSRVDPPVVAGTNVKPLAAAAPLVRTHFDAFVGNLPFMGGRRISTAHGQRYAEWLARIFESGGDTDYAAFVFARAASFLAEPGTIGFIVTNTIALGETRRSSLAPLVAKGMVIYDAVTDRPWEGAEVLVSIVHLAAGLTALGTPRRLNGVVVPEINSRLRASKELGDPQRLRANAGRAFVGCFLRGEGFVLSADEAAEHLRRFPDERAVMKEYMVGDDLNSSAQQIPSRWVITFWDSDLEQARRHPGAFALLDERVRPVRERLKMTGADAPHRRYWWRFANTRRDLRAACAIRAHCLVTARVSKHVMISRVASRFVFSEQVVVFGSDSYAWFGLLQSRLHELWVRRFATRLGEGLRYSASECFETFPFPSEAALSPSSELERAGSRLHDARVKYMLAQSVGLTVTYNRLKDRECVEPSIVALRRLHEDADRAVLDAYGWSGVEPPAYDAVDAAVEAFEDEVLQRLCALNTEQAAAEQKEATAGRTTGSARAPRSAKGARR